MSKFNARFVWIFFFAFLHAIDVIIAIFAILTYKNNFEVFLALVFLFFVFNAIVGSVLFSSVYGEGFVKGVQSFPQAIKLILTNGMEINTYHENIDNEKELH